jgi:hypothetical protein
METCGISGTRPQMLADLGGMGCSAKRRPMLASVAAHPDGKAAEGAEEQGLMVLGQAN